MMGCPVPLTADRCISMTLMTVLACLNSAKLALGK